MTGVVDTMVDPNLPPSKKLCDFAPSMLEALRDCGARIDGPRVLTPLRLFIPPGSPVGGRLLRLEAGDSMLVAADQPWSEVVVQLLKSKRETLSLKVR